jgi:hypothetical protein
MKRERKIQEVNLLLLLREVKRKNEKLVKILFL